MTDCFNCSLRNNWIDSNKETGIVLLNCEKVFLKENFIKSHATNSIFSTKLII